MKTIFLIVTVKKHKTLLKLKEMKKIGEKVEAGKKRKSEKVEAGKNRKPEKLNTQKFLDKREIIGYSNISNNYRY